MTFGLENCDSVCQHNVNHIKQSVLLLYLLCIYSSSADGELLLCQRRTAFMPTERPQEAADKRAELPLEESHSWNPTPPHTAVLSDHRTVRGSDRARFITWPCSALQRNLAGFLEQAANGQNEELELCEWSPEQIPRPGLDQLMLSCCAHSENSFLHELTWTIRATETENSHTDTPADMLHGFTVKAQPLWGDVRRPRSHSGSRSAAEHPADSSCF